MKFLSENLGTNTKLSEFLIVKEDNQISNAKNLLEIKKILSKERDELGTILSELKYEELERLEKLAKIQDKPHFFVSIFELAKGLKKSSDSQKITDVNLRHDVEGEALSHLLHAIFSTED